MANQLEIEILVAIKAGAKEIFVNLSQAERICSAGLRVVLQYYRQDGSMLTLEEFMGHLAVDTVDAAADLQPTLSYLERIRGKSVFENDLAIMEISLSAAGGFILRKRHKKRLLPAMLQPCKTLPCPLG
jgi:hypothetical protein